MGRYCRICGRTKPNERFSGRGHRTHVCKKCQQRPKAEFQAIEQKNAIFRFMKQTHISKANVAYLKEWSASDNKEVAEFARIVLEIAEVKPYKKRRLKVLAQKRPDLLRKLEATGLIFAHHW